jgi:DNA-repair protein XRCC1
MLTFYKRHKASSGYFNNAGGASLSSQASDNGFYQLKKNDSKRQRKSDVDDSPLPRRDVLPGEKARKRDDRGTSKTDDRDPSSTKKKIKVVDRPRAEPPRPKTIESPRPRAEAAKPKPARPPATKPSNRLLEGVFFVLSGFQNPLRGQIRDLGLKMGAKYRPDWDNSCTHLVQIKILLRSLIEFAFDELFFF